MGNDSKVMIGNRLRQLLKDNGFDTSRDSLVEDLGFNRSTLQKYLNDVRRPTLEDIVRIANYFNTSVDYLIGNSKYPLDTWDHKFLEEFFQYTSGEMIDHFKNRYDMDLSNEDIFSNLLFGFIELRFQQVLHNTLEDLSTKEKEERRKTYDLISSNLLSIVQLAMVTNDGKQELEALQNKITESINGEYSFADALNLEKLEGENNTRIEKINLLKSYIKVNIANGQKAIKMLEELSDIE